MKYWYTFNYDGSASSSFEDPFEGLENLLNRIQTSRNLELIFPNSNALSETQKEKIHQLLEKYNHDTTTN